ncbi:MAG: hypothetical protein HOV81_31635 [Kofleriaceae bacterium]|nr:hypothetical protein [Kofleriaceae bacterium]
MLLLLVAGQLSAQPAQPAPAHRSAPDIQAQTEEAAGHVKVDQQKVLALQALARKEKDVIKLSCVNDKMVQVKAESNLFDQSRAELTAVIETDARDGAFLTVMEGAERIRKLREEAEACIGQPELIDEVANDFTAPTIVDDPTAGLPFTTDTIVEPPAYASPFN